MQATVFTALLLLKAEQLEVGLLFLAGDVGQAELGYLPVLGNGLEAGAAGEQAEGNGNPDIAVGRDFQAEGFFGIGTAQVHHERLQHTLAVHRDRHLSAGLPANHLVDRSHAAALALAGDGQTVAVLGNGIDSVYPAENRRLAQKILENGGLILSEFPPGTEIRRYRFPQRNRIISGLAPLTIIVQAPEKSGALITADQALEQGRDVVVLAAGLEDVYGSGTIRLADQGAPVWEMPADIDSWLQRYEEVYGNKRKNEGKRERKEENDSDYCGVSRQGADH